MFFLYRATQYHYVNTVIMSRRGLLLKSAFCTHFAIVNWEVIKARLPFVLREGSSETAAPRRPPESAARPREEQPGSHPAVPGSSRPLPGGLSHRLPCSVLASQRDTPRGAGPSVRSALPIPRRYCGVCAAGRAPCSPERGAGARRARGCSARPHAARPGAGQEGEAPVHPGPGPHQLPSAPSPPPAGTATASERAALALPSLPRLSLTGFA